MCIYVAPEVLLANLLLYKHSISLADIDLYCQEVKKASFEKLYLDYNVNAVENAVQKYEKEFRKFQDRFYKNSNYNIYYFNGRFDKKISLLLEKIAQK